MNTGKRKKKEHSAETLNECTKLVKSIVEGDQLAARRTLRKLMEENISNRLEKIEKNKGIFGK